ncbi:MAG TPA: DNA polymerase IV, partial [Lactobacillus sp.]|nr:DNA polymerase IV [Lactobacillus sp.]
YFENEQDIFAAAWQLWQSVKLPKLAIRLLGITVTGLDPKQYENIDLPLG